MNFQRGVVRWTAGCLVTLLCSLLLTTIAVAAPGTVTYQYDDAGRLKNSSYLDGTSTLYSLDAAGNRTQTQAVLGTGVLQFSAATASVSEATTPFTISVSRTGTTAGAASVSYATANGTAVAGTDYTATSGTLSWTSGESAAKTISVPIANDTGMESNEIFTITLSNPSSGALVGPIAQTTVTIVDNDAASFSIANVTVNENSGSATFTVTKSGATSLTHNVSYATANGSAVAGSDYTATSGTLSFAPADISKIFTVVLTDDSIYEGGEAFTASLSNPTNGAILGNSSATATINDNDAAPGFSINNVSMSELAGTLTFTVTKSGNTVQPHAVSYATANGTASAGTDYTATSGTLSFTPTDVSKTFAVTIVDDTIYEGNETFIATLSGPTNGATISAATGTATIIEDDVQPSALNVSVVGASQLNLSWTVPSNGSVNYVYSIYRNGGYLSDTYNVTYIDGGLVAGTTYSYYVVAYDSENGSYMTVSNTASGTTAPNAPTGLSATGVSTTQIDLSWSPSSSAIGIAGYRVYRNGAQVGTSASASYSDTGLNPATSYSYTVSAYDSAGSNSGVSGSINGSTQAPYVPGSVNVHRAYHPSTGEHFYSLDAAEGPGAGFVYEGARFVALISALPSGTNPIYRCFFPARGKHFISLIPECDWAPGVINEGVYGHVYTSQVAGTIPLYRFFHSGNGDSLATTDYNEGASNGYSNDAFLGYVPPPMGTEQFTAASAYVAENGGSIVIPISRSWGTAGAASVTCTASTYGSGDGYASAGSDFSNAPTTISWSDGDGSTKSCIVPIYDDGTSEGYWYYYYDPYYGYYSWWIPEEYFQVTLTGSTAGYPTTIQVVISDNE